MIGDVSDKKRVDLPRKLRFVWWKDTEDKNLALNYPSVYNCRKQLSERTENHAGENLQTDIKWGDFVKNDNILKNRHTKVQGWIYTQRGAPADNTKHVIIIGLIRQGQVTRLKI